MKKLVLLVTVAAAVAVVAVGGVFFSAPDRPSRAVAMDVSELAGTGVLDGLTFEGHAGLSGEPADVADQWDFEDGLFVSRECERRCNYPPRPYFSREVGDTTEFISVTECPNKNATIVWRGTIDGETIEGEFTWTMERWYWTIERTFWFEGTLAEGMQPIARN